LKQQPGLIDRTFLGFIGAALMAYLHQSGTFQGTAAELLPKLCEVDSELKDRLSTKKLGKRLSNLWPHLHKTLAKAIKEPDRNGITHFTFQMDRAGCAGFQTVFS
jgi:hypothetical protein